jgi:hypothetical protein
MGKLLAELEKHSADRPTTTTSEPRPFSAIELSDLDASVRRIGVLKSGDETILW